MNATDTFVDERDLLLRLSEGDFDAFNHFYKRYGKIVFARLKSLIHEQEITEELHQDTFLKIWEHRASLNTMVPFQAIIMRTAKSIAIDYYRKAIRDDKLKKQLISTATELYHHLDELINFNETNTAINTAISKLPPQRLKIFTLIKLEGKTYEYAATKFGVSLSTIKDHMAKAMKFLRDEMAREHPETLFLLVAATLIR
ncbi:RNA polymerase sigma-70 factor (ECF subfamily) [Pedobacter sp. AK017]|uniref:RNA polymerase sigma factor n=1 Tax=Pedobacter sp. AK017 TaxID=2723073 RepID=UPI00160C0412|nr:sigma-70 family RNA polymerase sigma factor [Pedobacter sp. AK017]MBB5438160.1 RNA polymerase sigma-70 factor (ECF subfamily) [Pedobacter sp. AK017]